MEIHTTIILILEESDFTNDVNLIKERLLGIRLGGIVIPDNRFNNFEESELYNSIKSNCSIGGLRFFDFKKLNLYKKEIKLMVKNAKKV